MKPLPEETLQLEHVTNEVQSPCKEIKNDPFTIIENEDLMNIAINILKSRLPRSAHLYNMAKMASKYPSPSVTVYSLHGDLSENAIFLLISIRQDYNQDINISVPLDFKITEEVKQGFTNTSKIDWNSKYMFSAVDILIAPMIFEISAFHKRNSSLFNPNYYYYLSAEDAANLDVEIRPGMEVKPLTLDSIEGIDLLINGWKYTRPGTYEYLCEAIEQGMTAVVYVDGTPACGIMVNRSGLLGMLFTAKSHRNKGYAKIATQFMMKQLGMKGFVVASAVEAKNTASSEFHKKVGMMESHVCAYLLYEKVGFEAK